MAPDPQQALQEGMAALKRGDKAGAREHLTRAIELDENNEQAWLWMAGAVEEPAEMRICFENVLHLNPTNVRATQGVEWLRKQHPAVFVDPPPVAPAATGATVALNQPAAQAAPWETLVAPEIPPAATGATITLNQPAGPAAPSAAPPDKGYQVPAADGRQLVASSDHPPCPRCGKPTKISDQRCKACGFSLMIKTDRDPGSRVLVLIASIMSIIHNVLYIGASLFLLVVVINAWTKLKNAVVADIPPDRRAAAMKEAQPLLDEFYEQGIEPVINFGVIGLAIGIIGMVFCIGMIRMRRWAYWANWIHNGLHWLLYLALFVFIDRGVAFIRPMLSSSGTPQQVKQALTIMQGIGIFPAIYFTLIIVFMAFSWRLFTDQSVRFIPPDEDTGNAMEHFNRGIAYRKRGMWHQSMLEWERAVKISPGDATYRHALGLVYAQLKRRDDALRELDEANQLAPDNLAIAQDLQKVTGVAQ